MVDNTAPSHSAPSEPSCLGDPGECAYNEACMYQCQGEQASLPDVKATEPEMDADGEPINRCTVCGDPVRYGSRHSQCGAAVMAAEKATLAAAPIKPEPRPEPKWRNAAIKAGKNVVETCEQCGKDCGYVIIHSREWWKNLPHKTPLYAYQGKNAEPRQAPSDAPNYPSLYSFTGNITDLNTVCVPWAVIAAQEGKNNG